MDIDAQLIAQSESGTTITKENSGRQTLRGDPQKRREYLRKRYQENKEREFAKRKAYYEANKEKFQAYERNRQYLKMYGITIADYDRMLQEQKGGCAICKSPKPMASGKYKHFAVDHCHKTGRVRGLLCVTCNVALGKFEKYREQMVGYLKENG